MTGKQNPQHDRGLFSKLKEDLNAVDHIDELSREYRDFRDFYLDPRLQGRLREMGWFRKWFYFIWWLIRSMFLKLSPTRRLMAVLGVVMNINAVTFQIGPDAISDNTIWGTFLILFVLLLELKDKSLAKDELAAGRKIQTALMPERIPVFPGWSIWLYTSPANDVGGDLVDIMKFSDSLAGLAMADVAGKGLRAALLTAKLQATIRALATGNESLTGLCGNINRIFHRDSIASIFASLMYIEISAESGVIRYVNAGHLPPLVVSSAGAIEQDKGELALGLSPAADFTERAVTIDNGDLFVTYSDGLTEACNESGEFYGIDRLKAFLSIHRQFPADRLGEMLISNVGAFVGLARVNDDLSVIILKKN